MDSVCGLMGCLLWTFVSVQRSVQLEDGVEGSMLLLDVGMYPKDLNWSF
jgi:hypothetical protein